MASYDLGKQEVVNWIKNHFWQGATCLDVGACDGKYYDLLGNYLVMDAVEIFTPNIGWHQLEKKYRRVFNADIHGLTYDYYDLIIFGDVLEHMSIDKAQAVLEYAKHHCIDIIVGVPWLYPQGELYGNPYERHIQADLTEEVFNQRYHGFAKLFDFENKYAYFHLENPPRANQF